MIAIKNTTENNIWWIVKSTDGTIIHHGVLEPNVELTSGQETLQQFTTEQDWLNELTNLGVSIINENDLLTEFNIPYE